MRIWITPNPKVQSKWNFNTVNEKLYDEIAKIKMFSLHTAKVNEGQTQSVCERKSTNKKSKIKKELRIAAFVHFRCKMYFGKMLLPLELKMIKKLKFRCAQLRHKNHLVPLQMCFVGRDSILAVE